MGGHANVVRQLLERGLDVTTVDTRGNTALHFARTAECVYLLCEAGAAVDARNNIDMSPLQMACNTRHSLNGCVALLRCGADPCASWEDTFLGRRHYHLDADGETKVAPDGRTHRELGARHAHDAAGCVLCGLQRVRLERAIDALLAELPALMGPEYKPGSQEDAFDLWCRVAENMEARGLERGVVSGRIVQTMVCTSCGPQQPVDQPVVAHGTAATRWTS